MNQLRNTRAGRLAMIAALSLAGMSTGCGASNRPADSAQSARAGVGQDASMHARQSPNGSQVEIDKKLAALCNLPTPRFPFDSDAVGTDSATGLGALATCFLDGPAQGEAMNLVGHADPRGETMYNFGLGQRRAAAVASYLQRAGIAETRLQTSSRGELEATGADEQGWARDRRVEILLAD